MVGFDLWGQSFIFGAVFSVLVIIPCVLLTLIGRKMINQLGQYPSNTPAIQMSICFQLVILQAVTFSAFFAFYQFFSN